MKVRFAVAPGMREWSTDSWEEFAVGLEDRGFDTMWLSDVPLSSTIDPLVGLAFAAARTKRLKLGANVVPLGRNPLLLAKELAQIDQLSGGRLLLALVPGIGQPAERAALGASGKDRGIELEQTMGLLRAFWSGESVDCRRDGLEFTGLSVRPRPVQEPLELWLGGMGPKALERAGRLADGWLGAALTPPEAGKAKRQIEAAAASAGRTVDPEHFGLSLAVAITEPAPETWAQLAARRPDVDPRTLLPVGRAALRLAVEMLIGEGLS
ncbi:MAG TPA: LLM class flavin-dependent oxidoreductase, partial [Acidimicrobiales bacterium]|nr:LLM class flavin-dependent oxidoreductase [Acidimicrobiales bacterium]